MTTYTQLTNQEAFDRALFGLRKQGRPSRMKAGSCAYRGDEGRKCGVGFCIDDDKLARLMDDPSGDGDTSIGWLLQGEEFRELNLILGNVSLELLTRIQIAHDDYFGDFEADGESPAVAMAPWEAYMSGIATEHNLTYTPPEAA